MQSSLTEGGKKMSQTQDREITVTRVFDAPRELVWEAWTKQDHLARWWGPKGFSITTREFHAAPGGVWRFIMHGPDGTDYPNKIVFLEMEKPERIVYVASDDNEENTGQFHTTVTFAEEGKRTALTMRLLFPTPEARDFAIKEYGAIEGGRQTLDRLAALLATLS